MELQDRKHDKEKLEKQNYEDGGEELLEERRKKTLDDFLNWFHNAFAGHVTS